LRLKKVNEVSTQVLPKQDGGLTRRTFQREEEERRIQRKSHGSAQENALGKTNVGANHVNWNLKIFSVPSPTETIALKQHFSIEPDIP